MKTLLVLTLALACVAADRDDFRVVAHARVDPLDRLIKAVPDAPALRAAKSCPCSEACSCGCNAGGGCPCQRQAVPAFQAQPQPYRFQAQPVPSYGGGVRRGGG
jgi:hypothetical protein